MAKEENRATIFQEVFLDTSFIIAFFNKKDKNYHDARKIVKETLDKKNRVIFILSDYIFDELITLMKVRNVPPQEIKSIGDKILGSRLWRMVNIDETSFKHAWDLFKKYNDKDWSFTDTSSFQLMKDFQFQYYLSYDKHFSQFPKITKWNHSLSSPISEN